MAARGAQLNRQVKGMSSRGLSLRGLVTVVTVVLCLLAPGGLVLAEGEAAMGLTPVQVSEHLYVLGDTCNVYLITAGDAALAIDFGSALMLDHLEGVARARCLSILKSLG